MERMKGRPKKRLRRGRGRNPAPLLMMGRSFSLENHLGTCVIKHVFNVKERLEWLMKCVLMLVV